MSKEREAPQARPDFVNPIDIDKITETPGLLPYAHTAGGAVIRPEDKGKIRGRAMAAMVQQTDRQMQQLYKQMEVLANQAKELQRRVQVSEMIYGADMGSEPLVGHTYHLYEKHDGGYVLSMVAPSEWGRSFKYAAHVATVTLLADHTWDVMADEQREK
jgi:hypothetical protein